MKDKTKEPITARLKRMPLNYKNCYKQLCA